MLFCTENCHEISNVQEVDIKDEVSAASTDSCHDNVCTSQSATQFSSSSARVSVNRSKRLAYVACAQCGSIVQQKNFARHWRLHCRHPLQSTGTLASRRVSPYISQAVGVTSSVTHQATPFIRSTPRDEDQTNRLYPETAVRVSTCLLYTSPSPRDRTRSRMPSSA